MIDNKVNIFIFINIYFEYCIYTSALEGQGGSLGFFSVRLINRELIVKTIVKPEILKLS